MSRKKVVKEMEVEKGTTHADGLRGTGILGIPGALEMIDRGHTALVIRRTTIAITALGRLTWKLMWAGMFSFQ